MSGGRALFDVEPLGGPLGAVVGGVNFNRQSGPALFAAIQEAVTEHQILVFRDIDFTESQQVDLSSYFGEIQVHVLNQYHGTHPGIFMISNLGEDGVPIGEHPDPGAMIWHTDGSWARIPGYVTMLYALEIPERGGDTDFANMHAAYEALDSATKREIETMRVMHDLNDSRRRSGARVQMSKKQREAAPPVEKPLVRVHPLSGRKSLYLGEHGCYVVGMPEAEGRDLVNNLNAHASEARFVYTHQWRKRDLVMWDNRSTMHRATLFDTARDRRVLRRTTVQEDGPI